MNMLAAMCIRVAIMAASMSLMEAMAASNEIIPYACGGEGLASWTNDMTSVKAAKLTNEGLVIETADWRNVGIAADIPGRLKLGPDDEFTFRAKATCPSTGRPMAKGQIFAEYAGERGFGKSGAEFSWILDGKWHDYAIRAFDGSNGRALNRVKLGLPPEARSSGIVTIANVSIRHRPVPPCFTVMTAAADGFARVGAPVGIRVRLWNRGTVDAKNARLEIVSLPNEVRLLERPNVQRLIPRDGCANFRCTIVSDEPCEFALPFVLHADGANPQRVEVPVTIAAKLTPHKSDYVPEPKPPKSAYEVAACYFPGWMTAERWQKIERMCPERKPLLGWYDETNPEVVDWQIKWYSEHGIGILMMDWYWNRGNIRNEHWIRAFSRARWRRYLKWAVMWCNESPKPNHSAEDSRNAVRHWIGNYFKMPEYYRIDGKPVVGIFVPEHLMRDMGSQGTKSMLSEARQMARDAGYGGIHFIGYLRPCDDVDGAGPERLRSLGFDEVAIYNYFGHSGRGESPRRYSWKHVEDTSPTDWNARATASDVPFWPMVGTGRDERPWVNRTETYGRSADSFRRMCEAVRKFADAKGIRRIQLGPVNEWGEGSYIEPCVEFGFSMFDAVRDVFCEKPAEGWPENVVPSDVGLEVRELKPAHPAPRADVPLDLTDGNLHGWGPLGSHVKSVEPSTEGLRVIAASPTPAIICDYEPFEAADYDRLVVRMKTDWPHGTFRFYWRSEELQWCEAASATCPMAKDEGWHDYVFDLSSCPAWTQRIFELRLQPAGKESTQYVISSIRFEKGRQ